jgi:hypothetical protein
MIEGPINIGHIHFSSSSAKLSTAGKKALRLMAQEMADSNLTSAYLVGMTDRSGGNDANVALSAKRAEAAAAYLEKRLDALGIMNAVIRTESMELPMSLTARFRCSFIQLCKALTMGRHFQTTWRPFCYTAMAG